MDPGYRTAGRLYLERSMHNWTVEGQMRGTDSDLYLQLLQCDIQFQPNTM